MRTGSSLLVVVGLLLTLPASAPAEVEVTTLGPLTYYRNPGAPTLYASGFPGVPGEGRLVIENSGVTAGVVRLNGVTVASPELFTQKSRSLSVPVQLSETNRIDIELRSAPGTSVTVSVMQSIEAEAATVVRPRGGRLEWTGSISGLTGLALEVPPGAVEVATILSAEIDPAGATGSAALEDAGFRPVGPEVRLEPSDMPFLQAVAVRLRYDPALIPAGEKESTLRLFRPSDDVDRMEDVQPTAVDGVAHELTAELAHFSPYRIALPPWPLVLPFHWDVDEIKYFIAPDPYGHLWGHVDRGFLMDEVRTAIESWEPHQGRFRMTEVGSEGEANIVLEPTPHVANGISRLAVPVFRPRTYGADDTMTISLESSAAAEAFYSQDWQRGVASVVRHEVGQALGLLDNTVGESETSPYGIPAMWIAGRGDDPQDLFNRRITGDDIAALQEHYGPPTGQPTAVSGWGTATIDGVLAPMEWVGAARMEIEVWAQDGSGVPTPATFLIMNDQTQIYMALVAEPPSPPEFVRGFTSFAYEPQSGPVWLFDDSVDTETWLTTSMTTFTDRTTYLGPTGYIVKVDVQLGGRTDGAGAASYGDDLVIEMSHPLDSGDPYDISLPNPGDEVYLREFGTGWWFESGPGMFGAGVEVLYRVHAAP